MYTRFHTNYITIYCTRILLQNVKPVYRNQTPINTTRDFQYLELSRGRFHGGMSYCAFCWMVLDLGLPAIERRINGNKDSGLNTTIGKT